MSNNPYGKYVEGMDVLASLGETSGRIEALLDSADRLESLQDLVAASVAGQQHALVANLGENFDLMSKSPFFRVNSLVRCRTSSSGISVSAPAASPGRRPASRGSSAPGGEAGGWRLGGWPPPNPTPEVAA